MLATVYERETPPVRHRSPADLDSLRRDVHALATEYLSLPRGQHEIDRLRHEASWIVVAAAVWACEMSGTGYEYDKLTKPWPTDAIIAQFIYARRSDLRRVVNRIGQQLVLGDAAGIVRFYVDGLRLER